MKDRIKQIRLAYKTKDGSKPTQEKFASELGISKSAVVAYETGNRVPTSSAIQLICEKCKVNYEWLVNGVGEPYSKLTMEEELTRRFADVVVQGDGSFKKNVIETLLMLDPDKWEALYQIMSAIVNNTHDHDNQ